MTKLFEEGQIVTTIAGHTAEVVTTGSATMSVKHYLPHGTMITILHDRLTGKPVIPGPKKENFELTNIPSTIPSTGAYKVEDEKPKSLVKLFNEDIKMILVEIEEAYSEIGQILSDDILKTIKEKLHKRFF